MRKIIIGFAILLIFVITTVFVKQHYKLNKVQVAKESMQNLSTPLNSPNSISSKTFPSTNLEKPRKEVKEEEVSEEELEEASPEVPSLEMSSEEGKGNKASESEQPGGESQSESQEERSKSYLPIYGGAKIPDIPETRKLLARDHELYERLKMLTEKRKELQGRFPLERYQRGEISLEEHMKELKEWFKQDEEIAKERKAIHAERKRILEELLNYRED